MLGSHVHEIHITQNNVFEIVKEVEFTFCSMF